MSGKAVVAVNSISVDHGGGYPKVGIEAVILQGDISKLTASRVELALAASMNLQPDKPEPQPKPVPFFHGKPDGVPRPYKPAEPQHPEYVDSGIHKGCEWCISRFMGHYCAYICVEHIRKFKSYDECELSVHGGLTWFGSVDHVPGMKSGGRNWLGWDYDHLDDEEHGWQPVEVKNEVMEAIEEFTERYGK